VEPRGGKSDKFEGDLQGLHKPPVNHAATLNTSYPICLTIYPNHSNSISYFSKPIQSVDFYAINGSKVFSKSSVSEINISNLSEGLYVIKIYLQNGNSVIKKLMIN
jgi:hypothetical protein